MSVIRLFQSEPTTLCTISADGAIYWEPHANPTAIMRADLDYIGKVAILALWHATHQGDDK